MNGKHQLTRTIVVDAPAEAVWGVIADSSLLPEWAPPVDEVACIGGPEGLGSRRECKVDFSGKKGTMIERCVEFVPNRVAGFVVDEDTLGFSKMFADYGFTQTLEPIGAGRTELRIDTYYTPRNPLYSLMNRLMMRRQFTKTVDGLLEGLKRLSEQRDRGARR